MIIIVRTFENREERWTFLNQRKAKLRFGLLIDTGAPWSAAGMDWVARLIDTYQLSDFVTWTPHVAKLHGIGAGAATCNHKAEIPVGIDETDPGTTFKTQVLEGCGSRVPGLLGLDSMIRRKAIIDLSDPHEKQDYFMHVLRSDGQWASLKLELIQGHLILPIDKWPQTDWPSVPDNDFHERQAWTSHLVCR